jgi:hypothetical protein
LLLLSLLHSKYPGIPQNLLLNFFPACTLSSRSPVFML